MTDIQASQGAAEPQLPKITTMVGDRPVIDSGVVVLGRGETSFSVTIENLRLEFVFLADPGAVNVDAQVIDAALMRIRFTGHVGSFGVAYELPNFAVMFDRWVHLSAMVHTIEDSDVVRQVAYTLTWTEAPL
jgi:hypothetical protein